MKRKQLLVDPEKIKYHNSTFVARSQHLDVCHAIGYDRKHRVYFGWKTYIEKVIEDTIKIYIGYSQELNIPLSQEEIEEQKYLISIIS